MASEPAVRSDLHARKAETRCSFISEFSVRSRKAGAFSGWLVQ